MRTTAKQAAARLETLGFLILSHSEPDEAQDGMVAITDKVHVQVGPNYCHVVEEKEDGTFLFYPEAATYDKLAQDIREALPC